MATQRLYQRTGQRPAYMNKRWLPSNGAALPRLSTSIVCGALRGKTVGLIGDSMQQLLYQTIEGWGSDDSFVSGQNREKLELCNGSTRVLWRRHNMLQAPALESVRQLAAVTDLLLINFGVHWHSPDHMSEMLPRLLSMLRTSWRHHKPRSNIVWRTTTVAHQNCTHSETPHAAAKPSIRFHAREILAQECNVVVPQLRSFGASILDVQAATMRRTDGHRVLGHGGSHDCLHYCEPGVVDTWLAMLLAMIKSNGARERARMTMLRDEDDALQRMSNM